MGKWVNGSVGQWSMGQQVSGWWSVGQWLVGWWLVDLIKPTCSSEIIKLNRKYQVSVMLSFKHKYCFWKKQSRKL